uniref:Uncharacterized protein n=1 Tax=virus sp. ct5rm7 TaxID=2827298 RepID=A0A8S5RFT0_9VIRU|nr:MAG TPA: hypothetical protein [virus sp. ct5rm7]
MSGVCMAELTPYTHRFTLYTHSGKRNSLPVF